MYGAILGDIVGSPYEFNYGGMTKSFPLFGSHSQYTDDSVLTIAVADALMGTEPNDPEEQIRDTVIRSLRKWGNRFPSVGYGTLFSRWLRSRDPMPYYSCGNGSAMRVSSVGWLYEDIETVRKMARLSAEVTHNHPEGIKGAEAVASAIFLARKGYSKVDIRHYIFRNFGYDMTRTCEEIQSVPALSETCQDTVPIALNAFFEGFDFEDVLRTAVSFGRSCDTLACIAGSIAEAFYGIPENMKAECRKRIPRDMMEVIDRMDTKVGCDNASFHDPYLEGNTVIEQAIDHYYEDSSRENLAGVLGAIRKRMKEGGHFLIPVSQDPELDGLFYFRKIETLETGEWLALFTSTDECAKGEPCTIISNYADSTLQACTENNEKGFIINPWGNSFLLTNELIQMMMEADEMEVFQ